jgi:hypothetical protein
MAKSPVTIRRIELGSGVVIGLASNSARPDTFVMVPIGPIRVAAPVTGSIVYRFEKLLFAKAPYIVLLSGLKASPPKL